MLRLFKSPGLIPTFALGFSRPSLDIAIGTWRGMPGAVAVDLFTFIDELAPNDADYISQGLGNVASIYSCSMGPVATTLETGLTFRVRARSMGGDNPGLQTFNYDITRGAFAFSSTGNVLPTTFTTIGHTFTPGEVAAFKAAVGNVAFSLHGSGLGGGTNDAFEASWVELEYD